MNESTLPRRVPIRPCLRGAARSVLSLALLVASPSTGSAQAVVDTYDLNTDVSTPAVVGTADGVTFVVPSSGGAGFYENNTLYWFDLDSHDWRNTLWNAYQYTRFTSVDDTARKAYMGYILPDASTPVLSLVVEHFSLRNVDLEPRHVQLELAGTNLSWTMENSRYDGHDVTPAFLTTAPLAMTAASGNSELYRWKGLLGSPTALRVSPGATLRFNRVGDIGSSVVSEQLYFDNDVLRNTADVNNGTLELSYSGVVFNTGATPGVVGGAVTEGFVVRNGGLLSLNGTDGTFDRTKLDVRGSMLIDGSSLSLGSRGLLDVDDTLHLTSANVSVGQDATITAAVTKASGSTTLSTTAAQLNFIAFSSSISLQDSSTVLNIVGSGDVYAEDFVFLSGGTINLDMNPGTGALVLRGFAASLSGGGKVNIGPGNVLSIREGVLVLDDGTTVDNDGGIVVGGIGAHPASIRGPGVVSGSGTVQVLGGGVDVPIEGPDAVLELPDLNLDFESTLSLGINPSGRTATSLRVKALRLESIAPSLAPQLHLDVLASGDTVLAAGEKFVLVDYDDLLGSFGLAAPRFSNLPDGQVFQLGLNQYRIRYSDPEYGASHGGNDSVITLTVASATPGLQAILGRRMSVRNPGNDPVRRSVWMSAVDKQASGVIVGDPTTGDSTLSVIANGYNSTAQDFTLPAAGWRALRNGYRYADPKGAAGPVQSVRIAVQRNGTFVIQAKVVGKNGTLDVVPPNPGRDGGFILDLPGGGRHCVLFDTNTIQNDRYGEVWNIRNPSVRGCPVPSP